MAVDFCAISGEDLLVKIESTWKLAADTPNVLRYQLAIEKERQIEGAFGFLLQVVFLYCSSNSNL